MFCQLGLIYVEHIDFYHFWPKVFDAGEAGKDPALSGCEVKIEKPWRQRGLPSQPSCWVGFRIVLVGIVGDLISDVYSGSGAEISSTSLFQENLNSAFAK